MSLKYGPAIGAAALLVFSESIGTAQPNVAPQFKIEVKTEDRLIAPHYTCELRDSRTHQRFGEADLHPDDTCTFRDVPFGEYQMVVLDEQNRVLEEAVATVAQYSPMATVYLQARNESRPPSGPVSVDQLRHPPARKAFSAMASAQHFSEAGDYRRAAEQLEKAVRISPGFAEAWWNLAVQHIRMGDYARAVEEIQRGMEFAKAPAMQWCNLAYALARLQRFDEAVEAARTSLRLDSNSAQAHYVLGTLLARDRRTLAEALPHLEQSAKVFPAAAANLEAARKAFRATNEPAR